MHLKRLLKVLDECLPPETAMDGDRLGLQIQSGIEEVESVLVTLELNDEVIEEAAQQKADCIITFHPLIYRPITAIYEEDRVGRLLSKLIRNDIALISIHTTFDAYPEGTSKIFAQRLGLEVDGLLVPDTDRAGFGMGVMAKPPNPLNSLELVEKVSEVCMSPVRYTLGGKDLISKIAIVGGSGSSFIDDAIGSGADAFITADITYHTFHLVNGRMLLIDPGHYEMEQFVPSGIAQLLAGKVKKNDLKKISVSAIRTNPIEYYPNKENYQQRQRNYLNNNTMV